jgi:hypothetical protein
LFNRGVTHSSDIPRRTYQYYKWLINGVAGGPSNMVQVGEFAFLHNGITQSMMGVTVSNPPDNGNEPGEGIEKMIDDNLSTKWLNRTGMVTDGFAPVYFDFGTQSLFDSYRWATGNDSDSYPERTPKSWILYGSNDNSTWNILHNVLSFTAGNTPSTWQNIQYFN